MKRLAALSPLLALTGCSWLGLGPLDWISVAFARIDPDLFGVGVGVACFWIGWYLMGSTSSKDWEPTRYPQMPPARNPRGPMRTRSIGPNCANCGAPHEVGFCSFCLTPSPESAGEQRIDVTCLEDPEPRYLSVPGPLTREQQVALKREWEKHLDAGGIMTLEPGFDFRAIVHEGEAFIPKRFEPVLPVRPDQPDSDPR
jgi:hypothetical protein